MKRLNEKMVYLQRKIKNNTIKILVVVRLGLWFTGYTIQCDMGNSDIEPHPTKPS